MKNIYEKIPQKSDFFWNFVLHRLWRVQKNAIISYKVDFQNILVFFDIRGQKTAKIRPPSAMGETPWSKYVSAKRKNVFGRNPQKSSFFWDFSKLKLRKRKFPRLFVI